MKRLMIMGLFVLSLMLLFVLPTEAQPTESKAFTYSLWVTVQDSVLRTRLIHEIHDSFAQSRNWNYVANGMDMNSDIHIMIHTMPIRIVPLDDVQGLAVSLSVTPLFAPQWSDGGVMVVQNTISGVNYIARQSVEFTDNMMYRIYDSLLQSSRISSLP